MGDETNPGDLVVAGVERTLELAKTWLTWDGIPIETEDGERVYTPHKVIRRHTHHLIDHLAEIEALLAGVESRPDEWEASAMTTPADLARFMPHDLNEAEQCLRRLADIYVQRLSALDPAAWDASRDPHWTIREIVTHVAEPWYAEQLGDLS